MIDFEWYRSFISIYKHQSVSEAAKARILTQPAMSQHLAALEAEVGEPLFIRTTRKIVPTERGKELYSRLAPMVENLEKTTLEIRHSLQAEQAVSIGSPIDYFAVRALNKLKNCSLRVVHHNGEADALFEMLENNRTDLILTTQRFEKPGIEYKLMDQERFVIVAPVGMAEEATKEKPEEWLLKQRWISYGMELPIIRRLWREHFRKRPEINPVYIIPDLRGILTAVEHGIGISVLPEYLLSDSLAAGKIKWIYPELAASNNIYIGVKAKNKSDPLVQKIIDQLLSS
ncbi:LysR family transcriptional regulator [Bacillus mangrovi]|uniref:LysR family transcriptional regulator n=1 Tax=Metabacillus mangrovi TaxID=1491830 RepID=A0A7X2V617_9BACI|nr:LysR family transcriptional regulator [Metabacillus mangrovi]MTH54766.1 LysR family transcriptional regulator [Metabacillus mangrovi]